MIATALARCQSKAMSRVFIPRTGAAQMDHCGERLLVLQRCAADPCRSRISATL